MTDHHERELDAGEAGAHEMHEPPHGLFKYLVVFGGLITLTLVSYAIGNSSIKEHAPRVAWAGMMAVSCGKALLVMLFFMHLLWEANWKYVLTIPASMMSIFLVMMLVPDVGERTHKYSEARWLHAAWPDPGRFQREEEWKKVQAAEEEKAHRESHAP